MFNSGFNFVIKSVSLEQREVSGILTAQVRDKDGEALDYLGSKPYFIAWSKEIQDATRHLGEDKMSYGNVREQHSKKCVGKFIRLEFDDEKKIIYGVAKITDDAAWDNCKEGVYNAFSVGGELVSSRREGNIKYIIIKPREVSIVDSPALSVTHFDFVKDAATTIEKAFKSEKQLSDTSLGESTMANDVEKAAHKSLVEHVQALKAAVSAHKEACIKAASDHEGDMHGACDKVLEKLGGAMHGEDDSEKIAANSDVAKALEAIKTLTAELKAMKDEKVATEKAAADKLQAEKDSAQKAAVEKAAAEKLEAGLEDRLVDLHGRVHGGAYRALPSRRVYIQKEDGRQRPLGVAALEDKIVQQAVVTILNQIYEEDFLGFSYGFRPGRSQHDALDALSYALLKKKVNYILDADIEGFFDNLDKSWMIQFMEHRVADPRILRLIRKWLKAGVMEEGQWSEPQTGTPQGSVISPLLANVYLHYSFDLWVNVWRQKWAQGEVVVVRYADDTILGFQYQTDADRFLENLRERLAKFGLELHPDKTRRIEFGRFAEENRKRRGEGKPETFDFLGFTHISGKNSLGRFMVRRKTIRKRMRGKLRKIQQQLRMRMHDPLPQTGRWLRSVVQGHFNYYAVPGNLASLRPLILA